MFIEVVWGCDSFGQQASDHFVEHSDHFSNASTFSISNLTSLEKSAPKSEVEGTSIYQSMHANFEGAHIELIEAVIVSLR